MTDYIKKEDAVNAVADMLCFESNIETAGTCTRADFIDIAEDWLSEAQSADVAPVRHGRWMKHGTRDRMTCSCCGDYWEMGLEWTSDNFKGWFKFCPNCGAKMDGGESDD